MITPDMEMKIQHNYLPGQYEEDGQYQISHNYLLQQFSDYREIFAEIEELVKRCDYTLGKSVDQFENSVQQLTES